MPEDPRSLIETRGDALGELSYLALRGDQWGFVKKLGGLIGTLTGVPGGGKLGEAVGELLWKHSSNAKTQKVVGEQVAEDQRRELLRSELAALSTSEQLTGLEEQVFDLCFQVLQGGRRAVEEIVATIEQGQAESELAQRARHAELIGKLDGVQSADTPKPQNLPYGSLESLFKGREGFLDTLGAQLKTRDTAVIKACQAIHGMGGVGKTRTAVEFAHRYAQHYTALLFVIADSPENLKRGLAELCGPRVLNLLEKAVHDQEERVAAVIRWLQGHSGWLLIFDNVDTPEAAQAVEVLFGQLGSGHVILTSRIADWSGQVALLDLDVLDVAPAAEFLLERTQGRRVVSPQDPDFARTLADMLDGLALALEQAGAFIREQRISLVAYIERWTSKQEEAIAWHDAAKMQYPRSLSVTFEASAALLSDKAAELFCILAWLAPDPIPEIAVETLQISDDDRGLVLELADLHLIRMEAGRTFAVHRLVQEMMRMKQEGGGVVPSCLLAAMNWMARAFVGDPQDVQSWSVLGPLAVHVREVAKYGGLHGAPEPTSDLVNQVAVYLDMQALYGEAEPLKRWALAMDEAAYGNNHPRVAVRLNNLAALLQETNRLKEAEFLMRRALAIDEAAYGPKHIRVATGLNNLAVLLQEMNRLEEAEPLMWRALAIDEAADGPEYTKVARDLSNLGQLLQATGRLKEAEPLLRRAVAIDEEARGAEHPRVATHLANLAGLLKTTSRREEAEFHFRRALAIVEAAYGSEHPNIAAHLNNLSVLLQATNRPGEAEPLCRRALTIDERVYGPEHPNIARGLNNLARLLQDMNRLKEAEPLMRQAVTIFILSQRTAGYENPIFEGVLENYHQLLSEMGRTPEEIKRTIVALNQG